ncbi:MAG TPA: hypothetical protein VFB80_09530 [Pirellulaceae bacterium]|nr:hypothetical protein [Pirellulaceae bacterium]
MAELPATTAVVSAAQPLERPAVKVEEGPLAITWEQLDLPIPPDSVFEPWMITTRVQALEGKQVRIKGYMFGGLFQTSGIREFPLLREKDCPFGQGGQPHHAINVELAGSLRTSLTTEPVTVEGKFSVQPWTGPNGKTWSVYHMEVTKME